MSSTKSSLRLAVVLGLLTAIGPSGIDMYLPALPAISTGLGASAQATQASLMAFYLALGAGQLVAGPLSDQWGRRPPVLAGLALFIAASLGCALAPDIHWLVAFRLLQGLGACASMVTPRAVVRDLHAGAEAARLLSLLMTVYTVSPILAPLAGSVVAAASGWRAVFWVLAAVGATGVALVAFALPESRPRHARQAAGLGTALRGYGALLRDRRFLAPALLASSSLAAFFVYVANSSFVFTGHYGLSGRTYALLFALNAVGFVAGTSFGPRLTARIGPARSLRLAVAVQAGSVALLTVCIALGVDSLALLVLLLALTYGLNSLVVPSCFVLAMQDHPQLAGSASALIGTFNFAGGALAMAIAAPFMDGKPLSMVLAVAACCAVALAISWRMDAGAQRMPGADALLGRR
ncbi:multidrug effflux MFS transporter [Ramlibacter sp. G-1-2-2]|uniref:Bcr/CflA family efflux transporter n=1 Tax=Ramlibacter agri TaxID=2728837 RepID=A0A848H7E4_9BURK|nr:multidrug effflux MFS transporter [Ramlibacter agri]NML44453.1 multidrug effflux MFS transporter [Ramlibacter agri]